MAYGIPEQFYALKNRKVDGCSNKTLHLKHSLDDINFEPDNFSAKWMEAILTIWLRWMDRGFGGSD